MDSYLAFNYIQLEEEFANEECEHLSSYILPLFVQLIGTVVLIFSKYVQNLIQFIYNYKISPSVTDLAINQWLDPHIIVLGRQSFPTNLLHVHLVASFGSPSDDLLLLKVKRRNG